MTLRRNMPGCPCTCYGGPSWWYTAAVEIMGTEASLIRGIDASSTVIGRAHTWSGGTGSYVIWIGDLTWTWKESHWDSQMPSGPSWPYGWFYDVISNGGYSSEPAGGYDQGIYWYPVGAPSPHPAVSDPWIIGNVGSIDWNDAGVVCTFGTRDSWGADLFPAHITAIADWLDEGDHTLIMVSDWNLGAFFGAQEQACTDLGLSSWAKTGTIGPSGAPEETTDTSDHAAWTRRT
jgi:hypothetical protein